MIELTRLIEFFGNKQQFATAETLYSELLVPAIHVIGSSGSIYVPCISWVPEMPHDTNTSPKSASHVAVAGWFGLFEACPCRIVHVNGTISSIYDHIVIMYLFTINILLFDQNQCSF